MDTQLLSVVAAATCPSAVALLPVSPPAGKQRIKDDDRLKTCHLLFAKLLLRVSLEIKAAARQSLTVQFTEGFTAHTANS